MGQTGGNYLCPCGSGKMFKQCCLVKAAPAGMKNLAEALLNEIKEEVEKRHLSSMDEINSFIRDFMKGVNQEAMEDFLGFSPEQMHRMLDFALEDTEDIVNFNNNMEPAIYQQTPIVADSLIFLQALSEKEPLKATAKGNLPLTLVKELVEKLNIMEETKRWLFSVRSEEDSIGLNALRHILTMCGWIKIQKNHFSLTAKGKSVLMTGCSGAEYYHLLKTYTRKFNWASLDRFTEMRIIQQSFLFSLYILRELARDFIEDTILAGYFIGAFPMVLQEVRQTTVFDPRKEVTMCFSRRFLQWFCRYFGFVEIREEKIEGSFVRKRRFVKNTDFLEKYVIWKLPQTRSHSISSRNN
jgi:hypothetical protein